MIEDNGQMRSNKYKLGQIEASILDSFPDPIVIVDQNRNVLAANFPARELIGNDYLGLDLSMSIRDPKVSNQQYLKLKKRWLHLIFKLTL
tara:strand:- start:190 stop:459 length:270 start_codon:yes stop_codon:yes gene_type:complete